MTRAEIFIQVLSELSDTPEREIADLLASFRQTHPDSGWDEEVPDTETDNLLTYLRTATHSVLFWLSEAAERSACVNGLIQESTE